MIESVKELMLQFLWVPVVAAAYLLGSIRILRKCRKGDGAKNRHRQKKCWFHHLLSRPKVPSF